jgi:hypothetical protein
MMDAVAIMHSRQINAKIFEATIKAFFISFLCTGGGRAYLSGEAPPEAGPPRGIISRIFGIIFWHISIMADMSGTCANFFSCSSVRIYAVLS